MVSDNKISFKKLFFLRIFDFNMFTHSYVLTVYMWWQLWRWYAWREQIYIFRNNQIHYTTVFYLCDMSVVFYDIVRHNQQLLSTKMSRTVVTIWPVNLYCLLYSLQDKIIYTIYVWYSANIRMNLLIKKKSSYCHKLYDTSCIINFYKTMTVFSKQK